MESGAGAVHRVAFAGAAVVMRKELEQVEKHGTYPALARWADRWQVSFKGTAGYGECLQQAWEAVKSREAQHVSR